MRTPGNEKELAAGFLLSEGVIGCASDIVEIRILGSGKSNEILVELADNVDVDEWHLRRTTVLNSACGLCGKRSLDSVPISPFAAGDRAQVEADVLYSMPSLLRDHQAGFGVSGGLHAAALFTASGELLAAFEDIGRHNALDKLIGHCLFQDLISLAESILFMSSRGSFELVREEALRCPVCHARHDWGSFQPGNRVCPRPGHDVDRLRPRRSLQCLFG